MQLDKQLILALLTILMSGVVASFVTFKLNARLQRRDMMRGKAEALFSAFHDYCNNLRGHFLVYLPAMTGRVDASRTIEVAREQLLNADGSHFRNLEMLIGIYFPQLLPDLQELKTIRDSLNMILGDYHRNPSAAAALFPQYKKELTALDTQEQSFKQSLFRVTRRL